jgi:alkanesulfonate monooxygenase SsuD/methylene tetrahydromethanopterin reductase-like flavin-dependent oxidoreductase (luciferase family)
MGRSGNTGERPAEQVGPCSAAPATPVRNALLRVRARRFRRHPQQPADRIEQWYREYACDGFTLQPDVLLDSLEVIADEVIPLLRARGLYRDEYGSSTLRGHFASARPHHAPAVTAARR